MYRTEVSHLKTQSRYFNIKNILNKLVSVQIMKNAFKSCSVRLSRRSVTYMTILCKRVFYFVPEDVLIILGSYIDIL